MKKILLLLAFGLLANFCHSQTSFSNSSEKQEIKTYPNPAQSKSTISFTIQDDFVPVSATLTSSSGDPLGAWFFISGNKLFLPKLSKGVYFLKFLDKNNIAQTKKIVIQ
ncbi:T9SS type A sorting domain-containing protein [Candidatus Nomurabacteria bacterium]|nr:T9SS type A sorting domain-containing protein [Candidatus Nomurabacteria bacterium]